MPTINPNDGCHSSSDLTDRLLYALAAPIRRRILQSLMRGPASAKTLAAEYEMPLANVSYHLSAVLFKKCGVVELTEKHQRRGAMEKVYALKTEGFFDLIKWADLPAAMRSGLQGLALDDFVAAAVRSLEVEGDKPQDPGVLCLQPVAVDRKGRDEIIAALRQAQAIVKAVAERCETVDPALRTQLMVGTAAFEPGRR
jgi:DNA-binding transcriptional ArsR family regulator